MGSLIGGEWDKTQEYDPLFPNDYEKVIKEKRELKEKQRAEEKAREAEELAQIRSKERSEKVIANTSGISLVSRALVDDYSDEEDENDTRPVRTGGAAIAPPPSLIENTVKGESEPTGLGSGNLGKTSVAAKIMARMGYKEGQGLGKDEQGISRALEVEKTSIRGGKIIPNPEKEFAIPEPPVFAVPEAPVVGTLDSSNVSSPEQSITEIMKNPTKVVLLRNMVGPGEVDEELEPEVKEECSKYGEVMKCVIYELTGGSPEEAVRIFVEFKRVESAIKAVVDLNGRYFAGRVVKGNFYDVEKFKRLDLND